jgi:predicted HAD superfamily Cof-like phosphohydrolase
LVNAIQMVEQLHRHIGAPVADHPCLLPCHQSNASFLGAKLLELRWVATNFGSTTDDPLLLRLAMTLEELSEWLFAHARGDLVAVADAWADSLYVWLGHAVAEGLPAQELVAEIHASNMSKEAGQVSQPGKAVKGPGYRPPNLGPILALNLRSSPRNNDRPNDSTIGDQPMQPNVFWTSKDWKEQWEASDLQDLLAEAQAVCERPVICEVPTRAFCDEDTIAVGPPGMRCDQDTAVLLYDDSSLSVPGTNIDFDVEVNWDGEQFWVRPICTDELVAFLDEAPQTETLNRLLQARNTWLAEMEYQTLVELSAKDGMAWESQHGDRLAPDEKEKSQ